MAWTKRYGQKGVEDILSAAIKTTFISNRTHLHTPLGDWCNTTPSQTWPTYKDTGDTFYMAPTQIGATWTAHRLIGINSSQGLLYNTSVTSSSPPKQAVKISLQSRTAHTLIFSDSTTKEVTLNPRKKEAVIENSRALVRKTGPDCHLQGDITELAVALRNGIL